MFLDQGLFTVGMRDVMAGAHLTPGGFYRHFESKDQLVAEAVGAAFDRLLTKLEKETSGKSSAKALDRIVSLYLGQLRRKKTMKEEASYLCPIAMLGAELNHSDPRVQAAAIRGYQRFVHLIETQLQRMNQRDTLATATGIVSTLIGAVTLAGIDPDAASANRILSSAQAFTKKQYSKPEQARLPKRCTLI